MGLHLLTSLRNLSHEHASKHLDFESDHLECCSDSEYYQVRPKHKKHSDKRKHKSKPSHISQSSIEEDESSTYAKTLTKPQHKVAPEAQPQASTDPVFYRKVDMSDLPSQYTEEVETFRKILDLLDPRKTLPRSSTTVAGLDDEKGQHELRPRGPSAMLPLNPILKDAFEKFEQDFLASNLPEGKYIKPPASTTKHYKVGQPCFEDKLQELNKDFVKISISPKPSGAPMVKVPLHVLKELEQQAMQNLSTINFTATYARTSSSCNTVLEKGLHSAKATIEKAKAQILKGYNPERAIRWGYESAYDYFELKEIRILIQQRALACLSKSVAHILQRELYTTDNTGLLRRESEVTLLHPHLGESRRQELRNSPFWPTPLFKSQLVKDGEEFLLKKGTSKNTQGFGPYQNKPFCGPHQKKKRGSYRKRPYGGNSSQNSNQSFSSGRGKPNFRGSRGRFRTHNRGRGHGNLSSQ